MSQAAASSRSAGRYGEGPDVGRRVGAADRSVELWSIGEVLDRLRGEFPDITISKIRFLEAEGLVEPHRTPAGYRKFGPDDVDRLRFVLSAQRDHYLPLRVIKEHLDAADRGEESGLMTAHRIGGLPRIVPDADGHPSPATFAAQSTGAGEDNVLSRADLRAAAGIDDDLLAQMESYGLVASRPGGDRYDADAVAIAKAVGELAAHGLGPRHLRTVKTAADREVGLIDQLVAPVRGQRAGPSGARADETARELAAALLKLHALLVRAGLSGAGGA